MKYPPVRDDAPRMIDVDSEYIPYFYKNKEWYYCDEEDGLKLTEQAPEKARKSYRVYIGIL